MSKIQMINALADLGWPGDLIAKRVAGKQLTPEDLQRVKQACEQHQSDRNIFTATDLGIL